MPGDARAWSQRLVAGNCYEKDGALIGSFECDMNASCAESDSLGQDELAEGRVRLWLMERHGYEPQQIGDITTHFDSDTKHRTARVIVAAPPAGKPLMGGIQPKQHQRGWR